MQLLKVERTYLGSHSVTFWHVPQNNWIHFLIDMIFGTHIKNDIIFHLEISDEDLEKKITYCHELLELVDVLDPGCSRIRGQLLNELQAAMTIQTKRDFNNGKITKEAAQVRFLPKAAKFLQRFNSPFVSRLP